MAKESMEKVGDEAGLLTQKKKSGRGPGNKPPIRTMGKKDLEKEVGASRKRIKDLETAVQVSEEKKLPDDVIPPEMWGVFPGVVYDYLSERFGDHWKLSEEEILLYGQNIGKVAEKYLGAMAGENPELLGLGIVVVSVTLPRVMITLKQREENAGKGDQADGGGHGPRAEGIGEEQLGSKGAS